MPCFTYLDVDGCVQFTFTVRKRREIQVEAERFRETREGWGALAMLVCTRLDSFVVME